MQNLRYKLLFLTCALFTGVQTILGAINASEHYTYHTRIFLGNLGVRNPSTVPIRKISANDKFYNTAAGYANGTAIYLNEDIFQDGHHSEGINLFTCAHEAAHHALRHPYQTKRNSLAIEQEADVTAARMLCTHGYRWVVEEEVDFLRRLVRAGQGDFTDGKHPTTQQQYVYLRNVLEMNEDRKPNLGKAGEAKRDTGKAGPKRNADKVGPKRNGPNQNVGNKAGAKRNSDKVGRNKAGSERNPSNEDNSYRKRKPYKSGMEDLKDLLGQLNNLSREQKLLIAGIIGVRIMGWL